MNILLRFYGLGIKDIMQANIKIMNDCDVVFDGATYNGQVAVCLKPCCVYKLYAYSYGEEININFYVDCKRKNYYFYFPRSIYSKRVITFLMMDSNYPELFIERGKLILCQK